MNNMNVTLTKDDILQACKEYLERKYSITFHSNTIVAKIDQEISIEIQDVSPIYEHFSTIPVPEK